MNFSPASPPIVWDLADCTLPPPAPVETGDELIELASGFNSTNCDVEELESRFNHLYDLYRGDFSILSRLIHLCCPFYAAKLCLAGHYNKIQVLHIKLAAALREHPSHEEYSSKSIYVAEQMQQWGDRLSKQYLLLEAQQCYVYAFEILDHSMPSHILNDLQISLLEIIGDTHALLQNYPEAMKYHFSVLFHQRKSVHSFPKDQLHKKMVNNYRSFLDHLGVGEYAIDCVESLKPVTKTIKAIGDELLLQRKFKQAASIYRLGGLECREEARQATLLGDGRIAYDESCVVLPWDHQQSMLQSMRKEIEVLQGVNAQNVTTGKYIAALHEVVKRSMAILGPPPTIEVDMGFYKDTQTIPYAFIGLGSMSHSGMSLYSDLEFAILVQEATPEVLDYFAKLTQIIEMQTIFFGETSPMPDDSRFQRGLAFDDKGNTPLGAGQGRVGQVNLQLMGGENELNIKTPKEMAMIIPPKGHGIENLILSHALCSASFAFGDGHLFRSFLIERDNVLTPEIRHACTEAFITETLTFPPSLYQEGKLNVKKHFHRMVSLLILELSHHYNIDFELLKEDPKKQLTLIDRLNKLKEQGIIDALSAIHIERALNLAASMRNQAQIFYANEQEEVYEQGGSLHFTLADQRELFTVYHSLLIPLRKYVENLANSLSLQEPIPPLHLQQEIERRSLLIQVFGEYFQKSGASTLELFFQQAFSQFGTSLLALSAAEGQKKYDEAVHTLCNPSIEQNYYTLFLQALAPLEKHSPERIAMLWSERGFQHAIKVDWRRFSKKLGEVTQHGSPLHLNTWRSGKIALDLKFEEILTHGHIKKYNTHGRRSSHPFGQLYFKENPEMPGIELAVYFLTKLLFGTGAAFADFGFLTLRDHSTLFVQISETIEGTNFLDLLKADPTIASKINPTNFSLLVLAAFLIRPEDGRPDNFIATPKGQQVFLTCVDNDHAFAHQAVYKGLLGTQTPLVKSILFCLPQMQEVIDQQACEMFCRLDIASLLQQWLDELKNYNTKIFSLICTDATEGAALYSKLFNEQEIYVPAYLPQGLISCLYSKAVCLQSRLQKGRCTHIELMRYIEPELAAFFGQLSHKSPLEIYFEDIYRYSLKGNAYCTQSTATTMAQYQMGKALPKRLKIQTGDLQDAQSIRQEVAELGRQNQRQLIHTIEFELAAPNESLNSAQKELAWKGRGVGELHEVQKDLNAGRIASFQALSAYPAFQEEIINTMDFRTIPVAFQTPILQACVNLRPSQLKLRWCSPEIDFSRLLEDILRISGKGLTHLDISHSPGLQSTDLIGQYCPILQELILDDIVTLQTIESKQKSFFVSATFTNLRYFSAKRCPNLQSIVGLPQIRHWSLAGSPEQVALEWFSSDKLNRKAAQAQAEAFRFLELAIAEGNLEAASVKGLLSNLPAIAFGSIQWEMLYGNAGVAPPLPPYIQEFLASPCSHAPGKTNAETHLLVFKPSIVVKKDVTLNSMERLIAAPKSGRPVRYSRYWDEVKKPFGDKVSERREGYWFLLTRDALPDTQGKNFKEQIPILERYSTAQIRYQAPTMLEAVMGASIEYALTGTLLFGNGVYTHCHETLNGFQTAIGNFTKAGLEIRINYHPQSEPFGLAGCCVLE